MSQEVQKMDKDEEASVLKRRRRELKTVMSELSDILDWFQKNSSQMTSSVIYVELDEIIVSLDEVIDDIQCEIDVLEGND